MTGFGRGESTTDDWHIQVEVSGVNRKQIDVSLNLPGSLQEFEGDCRRLVTESVSRGRVQARVTLTHTANTHAHLVFDEELGRQYIEAARTLSESGGIETRLTAADLFRAPGLFQVEEGEAEAGDLREPVLDALGRALEQFRSTQENEGGHLREDLAGRIDEIEKKVRSILDLAPRVPERHRENLHARLAESGLEIDLDDDRVLREIALFAERCDISEEITRLESHFVQFRTYLQSGEPAGRSMDFLCQEINRELNTIGSKANDADIARHIVESKTELEKIREQVQNVQ